MCRYHDNEISIKVAKDNKKRLFLTDNAAAQMGEISMFSPVKAEVVGDSVLSIELTPTKRKAEDEKIGKAVKVLKF